ATDAPPLKEHRSSFSYVGPRQPVPTEIDPFRLYARLFAPLQDPALVARRLVERRSVLDFGASEIRRRSMQLPKKERDKLDLHATSIREYERRLGILATRPAGSCGAAPPLPAGFDVRDPDNVPQLLPAMLDLVALALTCGMTRVVTFPVGHSGLSWRYKWLGIDKNSHAD